jgi:hypothetical protein
MTVRRRTARCPQNLYPKNYGLLRINIRNSRQQIYFFIRKVAGWPNSNFFIGGNISSQPESFETAHQQVSDQNQL